MTVLTLTSVSRAIASSRAVLIFAVQMLFAHLKTTDQSVLAPLATLETRTLNAQMVNFLNFYCKQSLIVFPISEPKTPVPLPPECVVDDDCPYQKACRNQQCVNPCVVGDPCGRGAFCHIENHNPVCRCPTGFEGNPKTECRPRKLNYFLLCCKI